MIEDAKTPTFLGLSADEWHVIFLAILHTLTRRWEVPESEIDLWIPKYGVAYCTSWHLKYHYYLNVFWIPRELVIIAAVLYAGATNLPLLLKAGSALSGLPL